MARIAVVRLASLALVASAGAGCFYTAPIDQRPSISIGTTSQPVYRGAPVAYTATADDPDGNAVSFTWTVFACSDATTGTGDSHPGCDPGAYITGADSLLSFTVPKVRADLVTPVAAMLVVLDGVDSYGAVARPSQELAVAVEDQPPDIVVQARPRYGAVVGTAVVDTPIDIFASVGDADDGPAAVASPTWQVMSPVSQPAYELVDESAMQDPNDVSHIQLAKLLTPHGTGTWTIVATTTDPSGKSATASAAIQVVNDHPPCIAQTSPLAPPQGDELPIDAATLFQVEQVSDDLDPYPGVPGDPILGVTSFSWSLMVDGGARTPLTGATGNAVSIDPSTYAPGDQLELRVEIADRNHTPIDCADTDPTCSVISDDSCIQRLTWAVVIQ